jgi:hypothetical protein
MEPRIRWRRITRFPSPRRRVALHTCLQYFAPGIRTIRTTRVLHSSLGLQLCCSRLHNAWRCLCLSSADSHILPLRYCYISDTALTPYMFSIEILLWIHCVRGSLLISGNDTCWLHKQVHVIMFSHGAKHLLAQASMMINQTAFSGVSSEPRISTFAIWKSYRADS